MRFDEKNISIVGAAQAVGHVASLDPGPVVHRKRKWNPIGFAQLMLLDMCVLSAMQRLIYVLYPKYISSAFLRVKLRLLSRDMNFEKLKFISQI